MKSLAYDQPQPPFHPAIRFTGFAAITAGICLIAMASANATELNAPSGAADRSRSELVRTFKTTIRDERPFMRAESQLIGLDDRLRWGRYPTIVLRASPTKKSGR